MFADKKYKRNEKLSSEIQMNNKDKCLITSEKTIKILGICSFRYSMTGNIKFFSKIFPGQYSKYFY